MSLKHEQFFSSILLVGRGALIYGAMNGAFMPQALKKPSKNVASSGIEPLLHLTKAEMEQVNALILARAGSGVQLIPEVAKHLISSGGKRLRPMLTIASAKLVNADVQKARVLAASVEFMHTATLLHDDVVDKSDMRRGRKTARTLWGNEASVLVGDFLLGQAFKMMVETDSLPALRVLSNAAAVIAEGEVMQLEGARRLELTEERYFKVIEAKTAALFSAACEVGPCLANSSDEQRTALRDYGFNLGIAFQLIDDVLDYAGGTVMGKNAGDDLLEGKVTLPVIIAYRQASASQKKFWEACFAEHQVSEEQLNEAISLLHASGVLEETHSRAQVYAEKARAALSVFEESDLKAALSQVIDFCVERGF
jgi:octaprenyl-diphosphate synthase